MAKQQSFADKSKSKKKTDSVDVKCIVSQFDEATGSWKFRKKMVQVPTTADLKDMKF